MVKHTLCSLRDVTTFAFVVVSLSFYTVDYRVCEFGGDDCIKTPSVEDRTAHKYSSRLIERVGAIYEHLRLPCQLSELPPAPTRPPPVKKKTLRIGKLAEAKNSTKTSNSIVKEHPKWVEIEKQQIYPSRARKIYNWWWWIFFDSLSQRICVFLGRLRSRL